MPFGSIGAIRGQAQAYRRQSSKNDSLFPSFADVAGPALSALGAVGDVLSRPAYGLSEAYGEVAEGGGATEALGGLLRGVTGGYKEAEFPTLGERIVPEQEGEGFGRKVARFGADVVTDPLVLFGGPLTKGIGKAGLAAGRAVKATKAVQRFGKSDIAQSMSRAVFGTDYNVAKFGGRHGQAAVGRARRGVETARNLTAPQQMRIDSAMKSLGVKANDDAFWARVTEALEGGELSGLTKESAMAKVLRSEYDDWGTKFSRFVDDAGDQFETFNVRTGKSSPFKPEANYSPQFLKEEIASKLVTKRGITEQTEKLAKQLGVTKTEAARIIEFETGGLKKAGNIEYARTAANADVFERNALKNFLRYGNQVSNRLAMAQEFGVKGGRLTELLEGASAKGLARETIQTFRHGINKKFEPSPLAEIAPALLGLQVLTKLGPTSVIAQFGQHMNTVVQQGVGGYVKGLLKISTDPAVAKRAAMTVQGGIQAQMEQLLGRAGAAGGVTSGLASKYLGAIGFKWADAVPRRIAFAGAIPTAEKAVAKAIQKGAGWSDDLAELGVRKFDFDEFARAGKFSTQTENRIGLRAAKLTQFEPDFLSLPPMWQSPEMRVMMQFRSFINEQTRFMWKAVMKPAIKYLDTNGASGSIKPLTRALVAYPIAGQGVAGARELVREVSARAIGAKRNKRYKRKFDYDHPLAQLAKDSLYVGAFGIAGDILEQASRGNLLGWVAGPTIGDVSGMVESGISTGGGMLGGEFPGMQDVAEFGARHVPGRRLLPLTPKELTTASTRRGFPGAVRERFE